MGGLSEGTKMTSTTTSAAILPPTTTLSTRTTTSLVDAPSPGTPTTTGKQTASTTRTRTTSTTTSAAILPPTTTAATICLAIDCLPGWAVVGADHNGCGGSCVKQCRDAICTQDICSDGKGPRQIGDDCCACPTTTASPTSCLIVDCLPGWHVVG